MAAVANFAGPFVFGTAVAATVCKGIIQPEFSTVHVILAGVVGAIVWDLVTWWLGRPTSSSHALIGGLIGSTILAGGVGAILVPAPENLFLFFALTGIAFLAGVVGVLGFSIARREPVTLGAILLAGLFTGLLPSIVLGRIYLKGIVQVVVFMVAAPFIGLTFSFLFTLIVMRLE